MKTLLRWGVRLYPARWRARYSEEMLALVEDIRPRPRDLWDLLRGAIIMQVTSMNFPNIVAAFALAGVVAAGVWAWTKPDQYVSVAVVRMASAESPYATLSRLQRAQQSALSRGSLSQIIQREGLYGPERAKYPLEDIVQDMRNKGIMIRSADTPNGGGKDFVATVAFAYHDPAAAQKTVRDLVTALHAKESALEVLDPASLPEAPSGPNRLVMVGMGLAAGLFAGLLSAGVWMLWRRAQPWSLKRVAGFAAAGMAAGGAVALLIPNQYISTAVGRAQDAPGLQSAIAASLNDSTLTPLIRKYRLYPQEASRRALGDVAAAMRNQDIRVQHIESRFSRLAGGAAFTVSFRYPDRDKAMAVTGDLLSAITTAYTGVGGVETLDPPSIPLAPSSPNRLQIVALGIAAGLLLGLLSTRFRRPAPAVA
jgi:LPS O-antigen subunit length determinant protein (WzzB/FepE family)